MFNTLSTHTVLNTVIMQIAMIEMMMINTDDGKTVPTQELLEKTSRILQETLHLHFATVQVLLFETIVKMRITRIKT